MRRRLLLAALLAAWSTSGVRAGDDPPPSAVSLDWSVDAASDHVDGGLTTTGHRPYAEVRVVAGFDAFRLEAATWTEGRAPDAAFEAAFGLSQTFDTLDADASVTRRVAPGAPSVDEWILDGNVGRAVTDAVALNAGVSYTLPDEGGAYADLYGGADVTLANDWVVRTALDVEPDDGTGGAYLQAVAGLTVPLPHDFALSAEYTAEWYAAADTPSYRHWNAGLTWTGLDGVAFDLRWYGNDLSAADCPLQADYDCAGRVFARVTYTGRWPPAP